MMDRDEERFLEEFGARPGERACPPLDELLAAQAGVLPDEETSKHLISCPTCSALMHDFSEVADLQPQEKERIQRRIFSETGRQRSFAIPLAIAAALAIVVAAVTFWSPPRPLEIPRRAVEATRPPPPSETVFKLEPAPVILPAAVLTWRNDSDRAFATAFAEAIALYRDARYAEAAERFAAVTKRHRSSAEAFFYLGVSQLLVDRPVDAAASLTRARELDRGSLADHVAWYLALAHVKSGNKEAATTELTQLCSRQSERACAGLKELNQR